MSLPGSEQGLGWVWAQSRAGLCSKSSSFPQEGFGRSWTGSWLGGQVLLSSYTGWLRGIKNTCNSICFQRRRLGIALLEVNQLRSSEWNVSAAGAKVTFDLGWWLLLAPRAVPCRKAAAGARPVAPCFPECLSATGGSKPLHFLDVPWFLRHWQQMLWNQEKRWLRAHVNFLTNFRKNRCVFGWDGTWPASLCFYIFFFAFAL